MPAVAGETGWRKSFTNWSRSLTATGVGPAGSQLPANNRCCPLSQRERVRVRENVTNLATRTTESQLWFGRRRPKSATEINLHVRNGPRMIHTAVSVILDVTRDFLHDSAVLELRCQVGRLIELDLQFARA